MFNNKNIPEEVEEISEEEKTEQIKRKQIEDKIKIRKYIAVMKNKAGKLEEYKSDYIAKAQKQLSEGNKEAYNLTRNGLKVCMEKQKVLYQMINKLEFALEVNEMNSIFSNFIRCVNSISESMKSISDKIDVTKVTESYTRMAEKNAVQFEKMDDFLQEATESFSDMEMANNSISDKEINELILGKDSEEDESVDIDKEISEKISLIKKTVQG